MTRVRRPYRQRGQRRARRQHGRVLLVTAAACVVCGLVATVSVLLTPRPAVSSAPSVDVSDLEPGHFKFVRHPVRGPAGREHADILFVRLANDSLAAFRFPSKDGQRHAPDESSRPLWPCRRIDVQVARARIECESDLGNDVRVSQWDFEGRGVERTWSRLEKVTGHEEAGTFLIHP
jgi:hypothetical protein